MCLVSICVYSLSRMSCFDVCGISLSKISPGFAQTTITYSVERYPSRDMKLQYCRGMLRLALPQELGGAYVYLLSDHALFTTVVDIPIAGIVDAW